MNLSTHGTWTAESSNEYTKVDCTIDKEFSTPSSSTYYINFIGSDGSTYYGMFEGRSGYKLGGNLHDNASSRTWINYGGGMAGIYIKAGENAKYKSGVTGSYLYIGQLYKTI